MARKAKPARAKPGAGSVYQDRRGYWHALWSPPGGKRRHFSGGSEDAVREALKDAQALYRAGAPEDLATITVGEYLAGWLAAQKPLVRAITWQGLEQMVRRHLVPTLGHLRLIALRRSHVAAMMARLAETLAPESVNRVRAILRSALAEAEGLTINAAKDARPLPPSEPRRVWLDEGQVAAYLTACQTDRDGRILAMILAHALRRGEALALTWSAYDAAAKTLTISATSVKVAGGTVTGPPKTRASRDTMAIGEAAARILAAERRAQEAAGLYRPGGPMFLTERCKPYTGAVLFKAHRRILAAAGLPAVRLHDLRHSAGSLAARHLSLADAARFLRHSSPAITARVYLHPSRDATERAAGYMDTLFRPDAAHEATQTGGAAGD